IPPPSPPPCCPLLVVVVSEVGLALVPVIRNHASFSGSSVTLTLSHPWELKPVSVQNESSFTALVNQIG
ncbi:hypothetical protein BaRGS_00006371, partial [Batillaria attramentaria]